MSAIEDKYALELARHPSEPLKAAMVATGGDLGASLKLMAECDADPGFRDRQRDLVALEGADTFIPTKELVAYEILTIGRKNDANEDLRLRAYRLYCEVMGFIDKGAAVQISNQITQNRVMVVTARPNPDEWEKAAQQQQTKLIDAAYSAKAS